MKRDMMCWACQCTATPENPVYIVNQEQVCRECMDLLSDEAIGNYEQMQREVADIFRETERARNEAM